MKHLNVINTLFLLCSFSFLSFKILLTIPVNNPYDPVSFHTVFGSDKFYIPKKDRACISLHLSPFYQHSSGARNEYGRKVPEGDMFGRWNMLGLFFGSEAAPSSKPFQFDGTGAPTGSEVTDYPKLTEARRILDGLTEGGVASATNPGINHYRDYDIDKNYTDADSFDTEDDNTGHFSIPIDYEKMGIRGQLDFHLGYGIGLKVKSGLIDYTSTPTFYDKSAYFPNGGVDGDIEYTFSNNAIGYMKKYVMAEAKREKIGDELGFDIRKYEETVMEDTYVELYWSFPFELNDKNDEHVVTMIPYVSLGAWIPTGKRKKQDKAFSIPSGNDGFWGIVVDGSVDFDFPGTVQLGFGGGASFYDSRTYSHFRIPSNVYQQGFYPWSTSVRRTPGAVWYFNASFKAHEFIDNFSFFFDYIHTQHNKDEIKLLESDSYFRPDIIEQNSKWKTSVVHAGLNYSVSPGLELGMSFQATLDGVRVYNNTTILGTISFIF